MPHPPVFIFLSRHRRCHREELLVSQPWLRVQRRPKCRGILDSVLVIARDNAAAANLGLDIYGTPNAGFVLAYGDQFRSGVTEQSGAS